MMITVFTPAYNRAHLLPRVYESLCKQTFRDFEWLIVDDGSKDDTKSVVEKWRVESGEWRDSSEVESLKNEVRNHGVTEPRNYGTTEELITQNFKTDSTLYTLNSKLKTFPIRYFYQENGGKHRAISHGVREAEGELFLILDSDDMLPEDALETVARQYQNIIGDKSYAGVVGFDAYFDGRPVAKASFDILECTEIEFRNIYHIKGDMKEVFRTDVLREFPFPEIEGEKFCPEDLVWHRIARKYKFRYFNQVIYTVEYLPTGLSARLRKLRMDSPIASVIHYAEYNEFKLPIKQKTRNAINYWRFWYCLSSSKKQLAIIPRLSWHWLWTRPVGWLMHLNDLRITK